MLNKKLHIFREHSFESFDTDFLNSDKITPTKFKTARGKTYHTYSTRIFEKKLQIKADYYIGIDWLIENKAIIQVEPKVNTAISTYFNQQSEIEDDQELVIKNTNQKAKQDIEDAPKGDASVELDYLKMLFDVITHPTSAKHAKDLLLIDWKKNQIPITQQQDQLTPFLVIQFLQLLKQIVRKGLKKSYYPKEENLKGKVKGKILVGKHLKQNVFKNRLTSTYCSYQVFGEDSLENRFLKKVFQFVITYVENHKNVFSSIRDEVKLSINFCRPAFEHISTDIDELSLKHIKYNPFFKEYKEAIQIGQQLLKKFAYNISKTVEKEVTTPPFWIDMPYLFELYVYAKLLKSNPTDSSKIHFQFSTYGNALDFLISKKNSPMIIDTKYKLHYKWGKVHKDIRQVSGYARLKKVRDKLNRKDNEIIDCLIIYPNINTEDPTNESSTFNLTRIKEKMQPIPVYHQVFKLGINLPIIKCL